MLNGKSNLSGAKSLTNRCEPDVAATETPEMDSAFHQLQKLHALDVRVIIKGVISRSVPQ